MTLKTAFLLSCLLLTTSVFGDRIYKSDNNFNMDSLNRKIAVNEANNTVTVTNETLPTKFGAYLGKGALNIMPSLKTRTFASSMNFTLESNENPQFLIFYLTFPPGYGVLIPTSAPWNYAFAGTSNIYNLFTLLTASSADSSGNTIATFFHNVKMVQVPNGAKTLLQTRVTNAKNSFAKHTESASINSTIDTIANKLFTNNANYTLVESSALPNNGDESIPTFSASFSKVSLGTNEIIYLPTDESTHIWLNEAKDYLYIVDAGTPILVNGVSGLLNNPTS